MQKIFGLLLIIFSVNIAFAQPQESPIGYWKTIDDVTGKEKSILSIQPDQQGLLTATVVKIWPKPGKDENEVCEACTGDKHNQRIVGMTILTGLSQGESQWEGGRILDPNNGKTYRCTIRVVDQGKKLLVRGYIGLPLLGRSQIWHRITTPEQNKF